MMRNPSRWAASMAAFFIATALAAPASAARTLTWTVDCARGQSISRALEHAPPGLKLALIVRGTCNENVRIDRDDVTLQGDPATGATVNGPSATSPTIDIAANRITIDWLTVTGGGAGINIYGASDVRIGNSVIRNTGLDGISINESQAISVGSSKVQYASGIGIVANRGGVSINNSEIQFNKVAGVHIGSGSRLQATGNTFGANGSHGLGVFNDSVAMLWDTKITGNGTDPTAFFRQGVYIYFSHAEFRDGTIADNAGAGVVVVGSAHVFNHIIAGNGDPGIGASLGSKLAIDGTTISGNKGNGVLLMTNSTGQISSGTKIQNNNGNGIGVLESSKLLLYSAITVGGNARFGLYCDTAESSAADISWISFSPPNSEGSVSCTGY